MDKPKDKETLSAPLLSLARFGGLIQFFIVGLFIFLTFAVAQSPDTPKELSWVATLLGALGLLVALSAFQQVYKRIPHVLWNHWRRDAGIIAYRDGKMLGTYAFNAVPVSATHLRPFVVFDFPFKRQAKIVFSLFSHDAKGSLTYEARYQLRQGHNLLVPPRWMTLKDPLAGETWALKIDVEGVRLVTQKFALKAEQDSPANVSLNEDGEVEEWLSRVADGQADLSLDELLAYPPETADAPQRESDRA